ncbi:MAG: hypothetical protein ACE5J3_02025 [Methanosarcinales archaeon]
MEGRKMKRSKSDNKLTCIYCGHDALPADDLSFVSVKTGIVTGLTGERCTYCGEVFFDEESSKKIYESRKKNSVLIEIPKSFIEKIGAKDATELSISLDDKKIVLEKIGIQKSKVAMIG